MISLTAEAFKEKHGITKLARVLGSTIYEAHKVIDNESSNYSTRIIEIDGLYRVFRNECINQIAVSQVHGKKKKV